MNGHHGNFFETSTGHSPLKDGSDRRESLGKHISDDPRHFIFRRPTKKVDVLKNFERPFTPRGWLRSAWNFGKTRFRQFPIFHFSPPKKKNSRKCSSKFLPFFCFDVQKWNVGNRLKRVFPKFHADRSHVGGVKFKRSKVWHFFCFQRRKIK